MRTFLILFLMVATYAVEAQRNYFYLNLDINTPMTNTEWLGETSGRGGRIGYRAFIGDSKFSAGGEVSWAYFQEYQPTRTIENSTGAITTDYYTNINQYTLAASGQYNFRRGEDGHLFPYAGLGLGAMHNEFIASYNIYSEGQRSWGFLARPEVGLLVLFGEHRSLGLMTAVHYDYATTKSEGDQSQNFSPQYNNFSAVGVQLGIILMSRY